MNNRDKRNGRKLARRVLVATVFSALSAYSTAGFTAPEQTAAETQTSKWRVVTTTDDFRKATITTARLVSENRPSVGFRGQPTSATILTWKKPRANTYPVKIHFGQGAMPLARTETGCYYSSCKMQVRFNDGPIREYEIYEGSSSGRDTVFVDSKDFLKRAFEASKIQIRIRFYEQGNGDFLFLNQEKFSWEKN